MNGMNTQGQKDASRYARLLATKKKKMIIIRKKKKRNTGKHNWKQGGRQRTVKTGRHEKKWKKCTTDSQQLQCIHSNRADEAIQPTSGAATIMGSEWPFCVGVGALPHGLSPAHCCMKDAPFMLKVRLLKTEVMETLLYGCVTWALGLEHFAKLRTAHHNLLLRIIGFQGRRRADHRMSYAKALKEGTM